MATSPRDRYKDQRKEKKQSNERYRLAGDGGSPEGGKINVQNYQQAHNRPVDNYETGRFQESLHHQRKQKQKSNKNQDLQQLAQTNSASVSHQGAPSPQNKQDRQRGAQVVFDDQVERAQQTFYSHGSNKRSSQGFKLKDGGTQM